MEDISMKSRFFLKPALSLILSIVVYNSKFFIDNVQYRFIFNVSLLIIVAGLLVLAFLETSKDLKTTWIHFTRKKKVIIILALLGGYIISIFFLFFITF